MLKIDMSKFGFDFFLSRGKKVKSLEDGAKKYGGATKFDNFIISNYEGSEYVDIKEDNNEISVFVPSTINTNEKTDSKIETEKSMQYLERFYNLEDMRYYTTKGSWYSEDLQSVVIEDITIITLKIEKITEKDVKIFKRLASRIKRNMKQEGVTISINEAMAIV